MNGPQATSTLELEYNIEQTLESIVNVGLDEDLPWRRIKTRFYAAIKTLQPSELGPSNGPGLQTANLL